MIEKDCITCGATIAEPFPNSKYCPEHSRASALERFRRYNLTRPSRWKPSNHGSYKPASPAYWSTTTLCEVHGCGRNIRVVGIQAHAFRTHGLKLRELKKMHPRMFARRVRWIPDLQTRQRTQEVRLRHRLNQRSR